MPVCQLCKSGNRSYTHSRTSYHKKLLFKIMKEKKRIAIEKDGWYKYN